MAPPSTDARLSNLPQATPTVSMVGISWVGVVRCVQKVALVLLGGSRLMEQQLGVCWVLTPTSTITAWPHPHLLLGGSLGGGEKCSESSAIQSSALMEELKEP